uniref:NADH dehydrogenase subunit 2 n=1 Tax=Graffilla buccinicola TaxID=84095 RepID=A0A7G5XUJ3_9PLAT|nr:NADH dehydrogenase subunit 2 [Graffilla buccinicola]QNA49628.1 NADH dehydrogenase subunit 2 [Graffilla buccinicola]
MALLCILVSLLGALVVMLSESPLVVWLGLELNLFGLAPLLGVFIMRYYFVQMLGSLSFLVGWALGSGGVLSIVGICVKLGLAPYFVWYLEALKVVSWISIFLLATVQKVYLYTLLSGGWVVWAAVIVTVLCCLIYGTGEYGDWGDFRWGIGLLSLLDACVGVPLFYLGVWPFLWYFVVYSLSFGCVLVGTCIGSSVLVGAALLSLMGFPLTPLFYFKVSLLSVFLAGGAGGVLLAVCLVVQFLWYFIFFLRAGGWGVVYGGVVMWSVWLVGVCI